MSGDTKIDITSGGTTTVDSNNTIDILGLNNIKTEVDLVLPQPFRTNTGIDSRTELTITKPIITESSTDLALDIKPMTVDLCLSINFGGIPPTCIQFPYQTHFGITLFGMEVFGFNIAGESRVIIGDLPNRPHVALGGEHKAERLTSKHAHSQSEFGGGLRIQFD